jgi:ABC-type transport system involved in multi-copper enzyme maturation permease subunit
MLLVNKSIVQQELAHLKHATSRRWYILPLLVSVFLLAVPLISAPLVPQTFNSFTIFIDAQLIAAFAGAHLFFVIVCVRTAAIATSVLNREFVSGNWEMLILTGISARRIIWSKWWAVLRYMGIVYVVAALLRLGFWIIVVTIQPYNLFLFNFDDGLCFRFRSFLGPYCSRIDLFIRPISLQYLLLSGASLLAFTALGLTCASVFRHKPNIQVLSALMFRAILMLILVSIVYFGTHSLNVRETMVGIADESVFCDRGEPIFADCAEVYQKRNVLRILETVQITLFNLVDNGSLQQLNLLHPATLGSLARNGIAAVASLMLYAALIALLMNSARNTT